MKSSLPIPDSHLTLIRCLRSAFHDTSAERELAQTDWASLLKQAREHGVDTFLYPWLAKQLPDLFSTQASVPENAAPAVWRALFLQSLAQSVLRQNQLSALFADFKEAGLAIVPFKGAWLCETVYDDPAQRTMSDLDLLIRREDRDTAHARLLALGYTVKQNTLHNPFARDQSYDNPSYPWPIELHWDFVSRMVDGGPQPNLAAVWANTAESACYGQLSRQLSLEDCVSQLALHLLGHLFALPLRAHLDLALLMKRFGDRLSPERLNAASARWKTGAAVPFLLRFASDLFAVPLCQALDAFVGTADPTREAQACQALFNLPRARDRDGEVTLLRFKNASWAGRVLLIARRVFMPQEFLILYYPCARHAYGMPLAWLLRTRDLYRKRSDTLKAILKGGSPDVQFLSDADERSALVRWLLTKTNEPA